jgi:hypothetical protein
MTVSELRAALQQFGDETTIQVLEKTDEFGIEHWIEANEIEVVNSHGEEFVRIFGV